MVNLKKILKKIAVSVEQVLANIANIIKVGYKSNAFAPLVWFTALAIAVLSLFLFCIDDKILRYVLVGILCVVIIFPMVMYVVLLAKDPKLLQSESYRIEDKKLDLIAQKGSDIIISPVNLTVPPSNLPDNE